MQCKHSRRGTPQGKSHVLEIFHTRIKVFSQMIANYFIPLQESRKVSCNRTHHTPPMHPELHPRLNKFRL